MKSKIHEIPEIRVNPWLKNGKNRLIKEKITKSCITFRENKPNFKNIKIGVSSFETSKYEVLPAGSGEKTNPIKPNTNPKQTQSPKGQK